MQLISLEFHMINDLIMNFMIKSFKFFGAWNQTKPKESKPNK